MHIDFIKKYPNFKNVSAKGYIPNCFEEVSAIEKVKNNVAWTYFIDNLNGEEIVGTFYKKGIAKNNLKKIRIEKVIKKTGINYILNGKDTIFHLIVR